jgi:hypothetical protein
MAKGDGQNRNSYLGARDPLIAGFWRKERLDE